jgi:two-component system chemotaxis response regulator CheB
MIAAQTDEVDRALWVALRTLEERAALAHRLAERARERDQHPVDKAFTARARETEGEAMEIRQLLSTRAKMSHTVPDGEPVNAGPGLPADRAVGAAVTQKEKPRP